MAALGQVGSHRRNWHPAGAPQSCHSGSSPAPGWSSPRTAGRSESPSLAARQALAHLSTNDCARLYTPRRPSQRSLEARADARLVAPRSGAASHVHIPRASGLSGKMVGRSASRLDVRFRVHSTRSADGRHRDWAQRGWRLSRARQWIWSASSGLGPPYYSGAAAGWHRLHRPGANRSRSDDAFCLGLCNRVLSLAAGALALAGEATISILIEASVSQPVLNGWRGRSTPVIRAS